MAAHFICDKKDRDRPSLNSTLLLIGIGRNCECIFLPTVQGLYVITAF